MTNIVKSYIKPSLNIKQIFLESITQTVHWDLYSQDSDHGATFVYGHPYTALFLYSNEIQYHTGIILV